MKKIVLRSINALRKKFRRRKVETNNLSLLAEEKIVISNQQDLSEGIFEKVTLKLILLVNCLVAIKLLHLCVNFFTILCATRSFKKCHH